MHPNKSSYSEKNAASSRNWRHPECIKRSDGGVSEHNDSDLAGKFYPAKSESARSARVGHEIAEP